MAEGRKVNRGYKVFLTSKYLISFLCLVGFCLVELSALMSVSVGPVFGGGKVLTHLSATAFWPVIMYELAHYFALVLGLHLSIWLLWVWLCRSMQLTKMLFVLGFVFVLAGVYFFSASFYIASAAGENVVTIYGQENAYRLACSCFLFAFLIAVYGGFSLNKYQLSRRVIAIVLLYALLFLPFRPLNLMGSEQSERPNVIVLGVDSLRYDLVQSDLFKSVMPATERAFSEGVRYTNAFTPVARTFVSWTSILTGLAPLESGIRVNLQSVSEELRVGSLAYSFEARGYDTLYATDERRFSNIETDWGFGAVIGPKAGTADFIRGEFADIPLLNAFRLLPISEYAFPYLAFNRALKNTYLPDQFSGQIGHFLASRDKSKPLFLAAHLCIAHWPYVKAPATGYNEIENPYEYPPYIKALGIADQQVGDIFTALAKEGYLDNAVVMVFSDHGEGFKYDNTIDGLAKLAHGSNIFSAVQYKTPLVVSRYIDGKAVGLPSDNQNLVALYDFHPLLTAAPTASSEHALSRYQLRPDRRFIALESGFNPVDLAANGVNVAALVKSGIGFYDISEQSRLTVNSDALEKIKRAKQVGVTDGRYIVGRVPRPKSESADWYYWDIIASEGAKLDPASCDKFCDHVEAVHHHFGAWL